MIFLAVVIALIVWKMPIKRVGLCCDPTGGVVTALIISRSVQASNQVKQGQAQKKDYDYLADTARAQSEAKARADEKQAEIAEDVGSQEVKSEAIKGAELAGAQRVATAANQISGSTTAQDIAIDSMKKTQQNEINLKYNADTKAWAFENDARYARWEGAQQALQYNKAGKVASDSAKRKAGMTMLSSATSVFTGGTTPII